MSSDDSGFDKEAEREKLREKYERDRQDRENTRRMSELLLQGATMTGKHCNQCGDPIFRYDGQEFCPTCQQAAEGGANGEQAAAASDGRSAGEAPSANDAGESEEGRSAPSAGDEEPAISDEEQPATAGDQSGTPDDERPGTADERPDASDDEQSRESDDEPRVEIDGVRVADRHVDRSELRRPPSRQDGTDERTSPGRGQGDVRDRHRTSDSRSRRRAGDAPGRRAGDAPGRRTDNSPGRRAAGVDADAGDLGPAREALVRTVTDLARRAEETDDATHARELLAATREAAEALAALDGANR